MININVWEKVLLEPSASIKDAIKVLTESSLKIVLIVDSHRNLYGTITDGDIRRGLLKGFNMSDPIIEITNTKPIVVPLSFTRESVLKIMSANKILQIPIVSEDFKVVGLHLWDEGSNKSKRSNLMVIMAGGKGTRLMPKTEKTPKPMLHIGGKPILEHIICRAKSEGFTQFVLAINYLGEVIENYFSDGKSLGVKIEYLKESTPLGTAGALSLLDQPPKEAFIVTNGDVLTDINYGDMIDFHIQNEATATMAVQVHEFQNPFGVVATQGVNIVSYEEKPVTSTLVNAGVYVLDPFTLDLIESTTEYNMPTLFEVIRQHKLKTIAFPIHEKWIDLGTPIDLKKASEEFQVTRRDKMN